MMAKSQNQSKSFGDIAEPMIYTYHCLCTSLLFATTYPSDSLSRRSDPPSLDKALILPIPALPSRLRRILGGQSGSMDTLTSSSDEEDSADEEGQQQRGGDMDSGHEKVKRSANDEDGRFTILTGLKTSTSPVLTRKADGVEKRWIARCARCSTAVAYFLDWSQFIPGQQIPAVQTNDRKGRRQDVLYLLPGAVMSTQSMKEGKKQGDFDDVQQLQ